MDGIAQMRPQFHHIDAVTHVERATAAQRDPDDAATRAAPQARGFTQSYRQSRDDNPRSAAEKNLMQVAAEEKWTRLNYFDEEASLFRSVSWCSRLLTLCRMPKLTMHMLTFSWNNPILRSSCTLQCPTRSILTLSACHATTLAVVGRRSRSRVSSVRLLTSGMTTQIQRMKCS